MRVLLVLLAVQAVTSAITRSEMNSLKTDLKTFIRNKEERTWKLIQMSFHDCISGCDGCLEEQNPNNKGLLVTLAELKNRFKTVTIKIDFADFAVLAYTSAFELGLANAGRNIALSFSQGRTQCKAPNVNDKLPMANITNAPEFLSSTFGLTITEAVALIACGHSVGGTKVENSGHHGNWDCTNTQIDNGYAIEMLSLGWQLENLPGIKSTQWNRPRACSDGSAAMMLIADLSIRRRFSLSGDDVPSCRIDVCPRNNRNCGACSDQPTTINIITGFANNVRSLQNTCSTAFEKMLRKSSQSLSVV